MNQFWIKLILGVSPFAFSQFNVSDFNIQDTGIFITENSKVAHADALVVQDEKGPRLEVLYWDNVQDRHDKGILRIMNDDGTLIVQVDDVGGITYGPDYHPDEAAKIFWESVAKVDTTGVFCKELKERHGPER